MMETGFSLDWLSFTAKDISDMAASKALAFGMPFKSWTDVNAVHGYKLAKQHPFGHIVMSHPGRPEMGVHVMMTGQSMHKLNESGFDTLSLIPWCNSQGARITRLDLAIDVHETPVDIVGLTRVKQVKGDEGSAKKWNLITGSDNGVTLYIGSRKSEKFMRIYNKAAEQGLEGVMWSRFELEIKQDTCRTIADAITSLPSGEIPHYVKGLMRGLFNPNDPTYQQIMDVPSIPVGSTKDISDNTLKWLYDSVAKTLAKQMQLHNDEPVFEEFVRAVHANLKMLGGELPEQGED